MRKCTHRHRRGFFARLFVCTNPLVRSPNQVVWAKVCEACPHADNGVRTIQPRRLDKLPRGLGDTIADALHFVGIKQKRGCACPVRQEKANRAVSYERLPAFAQKSPVWRVLLWPLLKLLRLPTGFERETVLFRFAHGLGDAVQFTAVLAELRKRHPRTVFDIVVKRGQDSLFDGLVRNAFGVGFAEETDTARPAIDGRELVYDHEHTIAWHEPDACYGDSPSTKVEKCLREAFDVPPGLKTRYSIQVGREAHERAVRYLREVCPGWDDGRASGVDLAGWRKVAKSPPVAPAPVVLIHYQGNSAPSFKSLKTPDALHLAKLVRELGYEPVLLDWDRRSRIVKEGRHPWIHNPGAGHWLWPEGIGDGETIAALARLTTLNVGIDSGPGKIFEAVAGTTRGGFATLRGRAGTELLARPVPAIICWTRMHPVHYSSTAGHVTHLVPEHHRDYLRGDKDAGQRFFLQHYRHVTYRRNKLREGLLELVRAQLPALPREIHA